VSNKPQPVKLSKIYLDPNNPRHDAMQSELAIIHHLVANEDVKPLARHISNVGAVNPLEMVALVPHPTATNAYLVTEGNRRICALKLLADPDKAANEADKRYFRQLKSKMAEPIQEVLAVVFDEKDEARPWFALRHEGEQGGIGTKAWDPSQKARFSMQANKRHQNAQALQLIDYARQHQLMSVSELEKVSITTIARFLTTPAVRHTLGLVDGSSLNINVPTAEFERAATHILKDSITDDSDVHSRTDSKARQAYAAKLQREGVAAVTDGRQAQPPGADKVATGSKNSKSTAAGQVSGASTNTNTSPQGQRNNRSPDKRRTVVPSDFRARIQDKILKRMFDELRSLDAQDFSFSAVYLLRSVLEKGADLYLRQHVSTPKYKLHAKLEQLATLLESQGMHERQLKYLRTIANTIDDPASPDSLGHYVHGGAVPHKTYALRVWDSLEPVMAKVLSAA